MRIVTVDKPVPVPCRAQGVPERAYAFDGATAGMDLDDQVKLLLADRLQREDTEVKLRASLRACTE